MRVTWRGIQLALAGLWLVDAALQYQPFMFGHGFANQIIAPAGQGQPAPIADSVSWAAGLLGAHTVVWNAVFATVQLMLAAGLLWRPTVRVALVASFGWALSVWYLGEGIGGLGSGHADLLTGAPGAALLYAVLAAAAWPPFIAGARGLRRWTELPAPGPPARWTPVAWAVLWVGAGLLRALPGQNSGADLAGEVSGNADGAPGWLAAADHHLASFVGGTGTAVVAALIAVEVVIGVAGLAGRLRGYAAAAGILLSVAFWIFGQSLGALYTGQATDPDVAPLVVLLAVTLLSRLPQPATAPACQPEALPEPIPTE